MVNFITDEYCRKNFSCAVLWNNCLKRIFSLRFRQISARVALGVQMATSSIEMWSLPQQTVIMVQGYAALIHQMQHWSSTTHVEFWQQEHKLGGPLPFDVKHVGHPKLKCKGCFWRAVPAYKRLTVTLISPSAFTSSSMLLSMSDHGAPAGWLGTCKFRWRILCYHKDLLVVLFS